jgi:acetyltransferase-like isoleucine patch superfamily enzyme
MYANRRRFATTDYRLRTPDNYTCNAMPELSGFRASLAPVLRPVRARLGWFARSRRRSRYLRDGIEGMAMELRTTTNAHAAILRQFGATVGRDVSIHGPLQVVNADGDFRRLHIGDHVHLGTDVLIDLADDVVIEDFATLSMRCSIVTHIDVGPGPLRERRPRQQAPVRIGRGAYLGIGVSVLHGVTIGAEATIGAHALVDRDVAPGSKLVAPRARVAPGGD